jgi:hypothetical protein
VRAALGLVIALAGCTPEVVSGSYLCGPNASCPEGQVCSGADHICVLPGTDEPFSCAPDVNSEPDDSSANAYLIKNLGCVSLPFSVDSCMADQDNSDWMKFVAPSGCSVAADARVAFPIAFQRLSLELYDLDRDELLVSDGECEVGEPTPGDELRCLDATLVAGTNYGLHVKPAGDGNCGGACAYNRYTLTVQLGTPR